MRWLITGLMVLTTAGLAAAQGLPPREVLPQGGGFGRPGSQQIAAYIQIALNNPEPQERLGAVKYLGRVGDARALSALAQCAAFDRDRNVRIASGDAIVEVRRQLIRSTFHPRHHPDRVAGMIEGWYLFCLDRPVDAEGLATMTGKLRRGARPEEVFADVLASEEYYKRCNHEPGRWVARLYGDVLDRPPTRREVQEWLFRLRRAAGRRDVVLDFLTGARAELSTREISAGIGF